MSTIVPNLYWRLHLMKEAVDRKVYLRDIVLSVPLPPLFQIDKEEIPTYLGRLGEISWHKNNIGETYVQFGNFFGEDSPLNRGLFNIKILGELTNEYLSQLEDYLKKEIAADKLYPKCVFVEEVSYPIKNVSAFPNKAIIR